MSEQLPITLNVGGKTFCTMSSTLKREQPNYFTEIFEKKGWFNTSSIYFIDRNPAVFQWILDYLRGYDLCFHDGPLSLKHNQTALLNDTKFYKLPILEEIINKQLNPKPSREELLKALEDSEDEYQKEWRSRFHTLHAQSIPDEYINLEDLSERILGVNNEDIVTDLIEEQIDVRQMWIEKWKIARHVQSFRKIILSICMIVEYFFPKSPFAQNLGEKINAQLTEDPEFKITLMEAVKFYLHKRKGKPFSPFLKLFLNLIVSTYFQGLSQPRLERDKNPNFEEIISRYPELRDAYESFCQNV